jgi:hypothetical protein
MGLFFTIVAALVFFFVVLPILVANAGGILNGLFTTVCVIALIVFVAAAL